jgi:hypothetical protein
MYNSSNIDDIEYNNNDMPDNDESSSCNEGINVDNYILNEPSQEQQDIINAVKYGFNVQCNSVAGSGKTTTILCMACQMPEKQILQITYNSALKEEVRCKARKYNINNLQVESYNSFARYYIHDAKYNNDIKKIINQNIQLLEFSNKRTPPKNFDIIVIDEIQDMNIIYYTLIKKFLKDINKSIILVVMGDEYQGVYEYTGTNKRYLTMANKVWFENKQYKSLKLSTSYRVTKNIASFVNDVMLGENRIIAIKDINPKIDYYFTSKFASPRDFEYSIIDLIRNNVFLPSDIFILLPSLKETTYNYKKIENTLVNNGIKCYVPISEESILKTNIIEDKVVFTTFHQSKGRERKCVIIIGFDNSYLKYYAKDLNPYICPATLYVAVTRSSERLIIFDHSVDTDRNTGKSHGPLPFLKKKPYEIHKLNYINPYGKPVKEYETDNDITKLSIVTVTDLVKHINDSILDELSELIKLVFTVEKTADKYIEIDNEIDNEDISDLNGYIIPTYYEYKRNFNSTYLKYIIEVFYPINEEKTILNEKCNMLNVPWKNTEDIILTALLYDYAKNGLLHRIAQIKNYTWITDNILNDTYKILDNNIKNPKFFEHSLGCFCDNCEGKDYMPCGKTTKETIDNVGIKKTCYKYGKHVYENTKYTGVNISGVADVIDETTLWEIKCVDEIKIEHLLQLVVYAHIWLNTELRPLEFKIINAKSGEVRKLDWFEKEKIGKIVELLLESKYKKENIGNDEDFIKEIDENNNKYKYII